MLVPSSVDHKEITKMEKFIILKLQEFLEGEFPSQAEMSINDYSGMGKFIGNLSKALTGFDHKAAHRVFDWDCSQTRYHQKKFIVCTKSKKKGKLSCIL